MMRRALSFIGLLASITTLGCSSSDKAATGGPAHPGADAGNNGSGGGTGSGGGGGGGPIFPTNGAPITAPNQAWTWIPFDDTFCRDGSTSGLNISLSDTSDKVMIFLMGGGACFDPTTCAAGNPANDAQQHAAQTTGIFDRTNPANPVKDWNHVFIPYCTGDIFAGTNENGTISGLAPQKFVGRKNMEAYLNRLVPTFKNAGQILLTGISAGGFGAAVSADLFGRAFGADVPITLIDDSGPSMSSQYLPSCLQDKWRTLWGFDDSFLKDCGTSCPNHQDYSIDYSKFLAGKYPSRPSGVIDSNADGVITLFFGFGQNDCTGSILTPVSAAQFDAGLQDFREQMKAFPKFYTYFPAGVTHTWLSGPALYTEAEGGTPLIDWVTSIVDDQPTSNVGK